MKAKSTHIIICTALLLLSALPACKKIGENDNAGNDKLKALLIGNPNNTWQLKDADATTVWEDQIGAGWVQYTNQPGHINLSDCVRDNNYVSFRADYTFTQSVYTCNMFETNFPLFSQPGGTGSWKLASDQTLQLLDYGTYRLISVTNTDLVIADLHGTYHFVSVSKRPFLTHAQYLAGTDTKTWKISKLKIGGVEQPLTSVQTSNRLTFNLNGALTNSYINMINSQPVTGTWIYNDNQNKCVITLPAGQTPAVNQQWTVLELTETALTYSYFDGNIYYTMYWVPQP